MQKKNVLTMALSISLVGVIAVGGTLAYLTANTNTLTNQFTFTENGITLQLTETAEEPSSSNDFHGYTIEGDKTANATNNPDGIVYSNIVPGAVISKTPVLTVAKGSVDCYVYALVTGIDETNTKDFYTDWNDNWDVVEAFNGATGTLLKYSAMVTEENTESAAYQLSQIFDTVYVNNNLTDRVTFPAVTIKGYAIQADGTDADNAAIVYFGGTVASSNVGD